MKKAVLKLVLLAFGVALLAGCVMQPKDGGFGGVSPVSRELLTAVNYSPNNNYGLPTDGHKPWGDIIRTNWGITDTAVGTKLNPDGSWKAGTSGKVEIDGDADESQLFIQGHSTQTSPVVEIEKSDTTDIFTLSNTGVIAEATWQGTAVADAYVADDLTLTNITQITSRAHASLSSLSSDDHPIYAYLEGRSGGQSLIGGTDASDDLTLESTSDGSKGQVQIASGSVFKSLDIQTRCIRNQSDEDIEITMDNTLGPSTLIISNTSPGQVANLSVEGSILASVLILLERSSDPSEPTEGQTIIWMSDGTGKGDDGDVLIAGKAGGVTKWTTLFDHSAGDAW